jgi:glycosyltransferase involved in cell wall biosynthesis
MVRASFSIGFLHFGTKSRSFRTQARHRANQIGAGRNRSEFASPSLDREQARQLGIADRVELPVWFDPSETAALLQRTDILALPSFVETLPMAVIEAFAYSVAVVATPWCGSRSRCS